MGTLHHCFPRGQNTKGWTTRETEKKFALKRAKSQGFSFSLFPLDQRKGNNHFKKIDIYAFDYSAMELAWY